MFIDFKKRINYFAVGDLNFYNLPENFPNSK